MCCHAPMCLEMGRGTQLAAAGGHPALQRVAGLGDAGTLLATRSAEAGAALQH